MGICAILWEHEFECNYMVFSLMYMCKRNQSNITSGQHSCYCICTIKSTKSMTSAEWSMQFMWRKRNIESCRKCHLERKMLGANYGKLLACRNLSRVIIIIIIIIIIITAKAHWLFIDAAVYLARKMGQGSFKAKPSKT